MLADRARAGGRRRAGGVIVVPGHAAVFRRAAIGRRAPRISEVEFYSATPQDYLVAHPRNAMFGQLTEGLGARNGSCSRASPFR